MNKLFENLVKRKKGGLIFFSFFLIGIFAVIFNLNRLYPTYIDDWDYSFVYYTNNKLSSVFDIIPSMMKHYTMWGGRLVVHSLLQEFLYFGPFWADLFNSLMFVLYIVLIYKIVNINKNINPLLIPIIFFLTWFFQADLGETILWMTGSANYLWGTTILFAFLYSYYVYFNKMLYEQRSEIKINKNQLPYSVFFFIAGVIAGWTNENMVVAIGAIIFIMLLYIWRKYRRLKQWSITGFVGFGIGAILMIIAPGNFKRYKEELGIRGISDGKPTFDFYLENLKSLFDGIYEYLFVLIIVYACFVLVYWLTVDNSNKKKIILVSLLFFVATFIATFAMVASPVFKPRTWFGIISLLVIAIVIIVANLDFHRKKIFIPISICLAIGSILFVKTYLEGRNELIQIRQLVDEREVDLNEQKKEGKEDIVLHIRRFEKRDDLIIPKMYDFPNDPDHWMFKAYAHYHEVKSVKVIEDK